MLRYKVAQVYVETRPLKLLHSQWSNRRKKNSEEHDHCAIVISSKRYSEKRTDQTDIFENGFAGCLPELNINNINYINNTNEWKCSKFPAFSAEIFSFITFTFDSVLKNGSKKTQKVINETLKGWKVEECWKRTWKRRDHHQTIIKSSWQSCRSFTLLFYVEIIVLLFSWSQRFRNEWLKYKVYFILYLFLF